jgi:lactoylglutathione lyase
MVIGLHHVHVICGDVEKTAQYFKDIFEAEEVYRGTLGGFPFIRINLKGLTINLTGTEPGAGMLDAGKGNRGLDHFSLKIKDMESMVQHVQEKGVKILRGPGVSDTGNKFVFIEGPDGICLELMQLKEE